MQHGGNEGRLVGDAAQSGCALCLQVPLLVDHSTHGPLIPTAPFDSWRPPSTPPLVLTAFINPTPPSSPRHNRGVAHRPSSASSQSSPNVSSILSSSSSQPWRSSLSRRMSGNCSSGSSEQLNPIVVSCPLAAPLMDSVSETLVCGVNMHLESSDNLLQTWIYAAALIQMNVFLPQISSTC